MIIGKRLKTPQFPAAGVYTARVTSLALKRPIFLSIGNISRLTFRSTIRGSGGDSDLTPKEKERQESHRDRLQCHILTSQRYLFLSFPGNAFIENVHNSSNGSLMKREISTAPKTFCDMNLKVRSSKKRDISSNRVFASQKCMSFRTV